MARAGTLAFQLRPILARTHRAEWTAERYARDDRVSPIGSAARIREVRRGVEAGAGIGMFGYGGGRTPHDPRPIGPSCSAAPGISRIDGIRTASSLGRQL